MPRYPDAAGYLLELRDSVNEVWFHAMCDLALASNGSEPTQEQLRHLQECFHGTATHAAIAAAVPPRPTAAAALAQPVFLESLSAFSGFKKLVPALSVCFDRQLTIIFGRNGSGKSSLCQALKVLANPHAPPEPLHNVRSAHPVIPTFTFKFRDDPTALTWTQAAGFGSQAQKLKYFDATIAFKHITDALEPTAAVAVAAFRLELFDYAGLVTSAFATSASGVVNEEAGRLQQQIETAKDGLASMVNMLAPPFDQWSALNSDGTIAYLNTLSPFDQHAAARLREQLGVLAQLTAATTDEGIRALQAQLALLNQLEGQIDLLQRSCTAVSLATLQVQETTLMQKQAASRELAGQSFPEGVDGQKHHALIAAAANMYDLSTFKANEHVCPLCNETMTAASQELFAAYHRYLTSTLQREISVIENTLRTGRVALQRVATFALNDFGVCRDLLPAATLESLTDLVTVVVGAIPATNQPLSSGNSDHFQRHTELAGYLTTIRAARERLAEAVRVGTNDRAQLSARITVVQTEIGNLKAHDTLWRQREALLELCRQSTILAPRHRRVVTYDFPSRLRAMTLKGKEAHSELVLATFEQRLSGEYQGLCGATLAEMGVRLMTRGAQQDVIVTPQVGDVPVHRVLSEGEQKVHSLAVFMCEAAMTPHRVLVFDDPATSFDYNHVSNFCERLRNHVRDNANTQIIVLTHNWDFFVNLQTTINRSGLDGRMSIQVLENCATVRPYSENWDELMNEIQDVLVPAGEPSAQDKERVAGLMRRLVERLTNKHVFADQRHQYKPKTLRDSDFRAFTRVVPLLPAEADTLRDLFANLSPPEHDDPRNFYTTRSKAQFQTWLGQIQTIKAALEARLPPP